MLTNVPITVDHHITTPSSASIIRVVARPRVFGIKKDSCLTVTPKSHWTLMDAGANICLTSDATILTDAVPIPPLSITVALHGDSSSSFDNCCTQMGYLPLPMTDGSIHWQQCFYSANAVKTIISPQAILATSNVFASWTMTGYKDYCPGAIRFDGHDGSLCMAIELECRDGLYYCPTDVFTIGTCPSTSRLVETEHCRANRTVTTPTPPVLRCSSCFEPTSKAQQLESEI
jgi:hypothetical protein